MLEQVKVRPRPGWPPAKARRRPAVARKAAHALRDCIVEAVLIVLHALREGRAVEAFIQDDEQRVDERDDLC